MNLSRAIMQKDYALVKELVFKEYESSQCYLSGVIISIQSDLFEASVSGHIETVKSILEIPCIDVNFDEELVPITMIKWPRIFTELVAHRTYTINRALGKFGGRTILHLAVLNGILPAVEVLLTRDRIFLSPLDGEERTPLYHAAASGRIEIIKAILNHDRFQDSMHDFEIENSLKIAKFKCYQQVVQLLTDFIKSL